MPVVYRCRVCGYVLYVHWRVGQSSYGVPTPSEVSSWYGGRCPRCGHPLARPGLDDVTVVADKELVVARVELLKRELEERRRPTLPILYVPVRRGVGVAAHGSA